MRSFFRTKKLTSLLVLCLGILLYSCMEERVEPDLYGSLKGQVIYEDTGEGNRGVPNVTITTNPATEIIVTDSLGNFVMDSLKVGEYNVIAKKEGYIGNASQLAIDFNKETEITIELLRIVQGNTVPEIAKEAIPVNNATNQPLELDLHWSASDVNASDLLSYDIFLYKSEEGSQKIAQGIEDTTFTVSGLDYGKTYFWQVIAKDDQGAKVNGPVWTFSTVAYPDNEFFFSRKVNGNYEIFSSDVNQDSLVRLTDRPAKDWAPRYNRLTGKLAFTSNEEGDEFIYTMNTDGTDIRKISNLPVTGYFHDGSAFCWANDGSRLIFSHYDKLYRINADGSGLTLLTTAPANRHFRRVDWSDQVNKIVVETVGVNAWDTEIYLMDEDGSNSRMLAGNHAGTISSPVFSIDGQSILFTLDESGYQSTTGRQLDANMMMMTISDSTVINLSPTKPDGTNDLHPRFSADGSKVIFMNVNNADPSSSQVMMIPLNTTTGSEAYTRTALFENAFTPEWK